MGHKTKIDAGDGGHDLVITRVFDLPLSLLFRAYVEPEIVAEWMGTRVLKLENKRHGGYQFETSDADGNVLLRMHGTIHDLVPEQTITRTFEMEGTPFPVQLEFLEFEALTDETSKLKMQIVYRSGADRDQMLQLPFARGLGMAHDRLQETAGKLK